LHSDIRSDVDKGEKRRNICQLGSYDGGTQQERLTVAGSQGSGLSIFWGDIGFLASLVDADVDNKRSPPPSSSWRVEIVVFIS